MKFKKNPKTKKEISLYSSVDSDDAFMFFALKKKMIDTSPFIFRFYQGDTEDLNNLSLEGDPDIIAVSIFTYGLIANKYILFPHSGSVGRNYGPVIVSRNPYKIEDLPDLKVATPGEKTTAHCIFKMISPETKTTTIPIVPFSEIFRAIDNKEVDAGILIHEGRLIYKNLGYHLIVDSGKWWFDKTGLPLPLGGTVINKALGEDVIYIISSYLKSSIEYALKNKEMVMDEILKERKKEGKKELNRDTINEYLNLYANYDTLNWGDDGRKAIQTFLDLSFEHGFYPSKVMAEFTP